MAEAVPVETLGFKETQCYKLFFMFETGPLLSILKAVYLDW